MSKQIFEKEDSSEKLQMLEDNCYGKEEMDFTREYASEDLAKLKHEFSQNMVFLAKKQEELDILKKDFKIEMDPVKLEAATRLKGIRSKHKEVQETVFAFDDQENGVMEFYDKDGIMIHSRPLSQQERQLTISKPAKEAKN